MEGSIERRDDDADCGGPLTLASGLLDTHPDPALILADGRVQAANPRALRLREAIEGGLAPDILALAAEVGDEGVATVESLVLPADNGSQILEVTLLPLADRRVLALGRDLTLEANLRAALVESRQRYKDLVQISSDFAWEVGKDGRFVFVSPRGALGYGADRLVGHAPDEFLVGRQNGVEPQPSPFGCSHPVDGTEVWMRRANGEVACLLASAAPLLGKDGERRGSRGVCRDVTLERARDAALGRANNRERLLNYIVRTIRDVVDPSDMLKAAAEATARALGASGCQIFRMEGRAGGHTLAAEFGACGDAAPVMQALVAADHHETRLGLATVSRYRHAVNGAVCLWRDAEALPWSDDDRLLIDDVANQIGIANEQITNHERILTLSRTDALTGLFNRRAFFEELGRRYLRLTRERRSAALIYVDLDNFKLVNDAHGHQKGDEALLAVRDLLLSHTRPSDLVARLGGDEFALWLEGADQVVAIRRSTSLVAAGEELACWSGSADAPLHLSLGVAVHDPERPESLQELLARADHAMYEVKRGGKAAWLLAPPATGEGAGGDE
ncbi:MAG: diguanylate cyclase [Alphaproteobacteria bacterium]|nr:diguanylate cyclase [Alphaproteobacteria bacterium]